MGLMRVCLQIVVGMVVSGQCSQKLAPSYFSVISHYEALHISLI